MRYQINNETCNRNSDSRRGVDQALLQKILKTEENLLAETVLDSGDIEAPHTEKAPDPEKTILVRYSGTLC